MKNRSSVFILAALLLLFTGTTVLSQSLYPPGLLNQKGNFSRGATNAMGQPFRGMATAAGSVEGL